MSGDKIAVAFIIPGVLCPRTGANAVMWLNACYRQLPARKLITI